MGTEERTPGTPAAGGARRGGDPLGMTEAEKLVAEWEARHDVAARGHRSAPDVLQHYLAHERLVHERRAGGRQAPGRSTAATGPESAGNDAGRPQTTEGVEPPAAAGAHGFFGRLFHRRG